MGPRQIGHRGAAGKCMMCPSLGSLREAGCSYLCRLCNQHIVWYPCRQGNLVIAWPSWNLVLQIVQSEFLRHVSASRSSRGRVSSNKSSSGMSVKGTRLTGGPTSTSAGCTDACPAEPNDPLVVIVVPGELCDADPPFWSALISPMTPSAIAPMLSRRARVSANAAGLFVMAERSAFSTTFLKYCIGPVGAFIHPLHALSQLEVLCHRLFDSTA